MRLIDYGKITKVRGLKGGLKVVPFSGDPSSLQTVSRVFIKSLFSSESVPQSFEIKEKQIGRKIAILKISGVDSREDASRFCGSTVMVAKSDLPEAGEGEYYNFQLLGLCAVRQDGSEIGTVASVLQTGFQSVLVILTAAGELLVPMVEKFVVGVDIEKGRVEIRNTEVFENL